MQTRERCLVFFLFLTFALLAVSAQLSAAESSRHFDLGALWAPNDEVVARIKKQCGKQGGEKLERCFQAMMRQQRASREATDFCKAIGSAGYMRDYRDEGEVDIAYVVFPFRANENQGCLLINGLPPIIDVDDQSHLPLAEMKASRHYRKLEKEASEITLWPGDRNGTDYPQVAPLENKGKRFIFLYQLKSGCHACKLLGHARVAFDFDHEGRFIGASFVDLMIEG